ncbi:MAG TPA: phosphonate ABC transporter, permease protein PhnE [Symbiobacteriaceae bacterium]|jgi:phosphonate transport system permease protein
MKPEPAPKMLSARWQEMRGTKTLLSAIAVILIYFWASAGLGINVTQFTSGETWRQMGDLVIRMGPFYRINSCKDAQTAWGNDEPVAGKPNPAKVQAVCDQGKTEYLWYPDYIGEQWAYAKQSSDPLLTTFKMAILGSFLGALFAVPFSLLAARNLVKSKAVYYTVRTFNNLVRTIPDLVLASVLTGMFGLGAIPAIGALAIFSFALVAKMASESIEAIDPGPLEAMQACGANRLQQIRYGVVPQVLPQYLSYTLYVLEVDVRASTVLGLVGAGGIGQLLYADLNLMRYRNVGAIVVVLLISVLLVDIVSTKLRERLV